MKVCDNCRKKIDGVAHYCVKIEMYGCQGAYVSQGSQYIELCDDCRKKMLSALENVEVK